MKRFYPKWTNIESGKLTVWTNQEWAQMFHYWILASNKKLSQMMNSGVVSSDFRNFDKNSSNNFESKFSTKMDMNFWNRNKRNSTWQYHWWRGNWRNCSPSRCWRRWRRLWWSWGRRWSWWSWYQARALRKFCRWSLWRNSNGRRTVSRITRRC